MAKSDKITVEARVHDVLRLVLSGAEFAAIRQYGSDRGWDVSGRQIRRYMDSAYAQLVEITGRDRKQLLGRHLAQRQALYARAVKGGDIRTALQALRDEANLQGLYPPTKIAPTTPDGQHPYRSAFTTVPIRDRIAKILVAEAKGDTAAKVEVNKSSPRVCLRVLDTWLSYNLLGSMAKMYIIEQLDAMVMVINGLFCDLLDGPEGDPEGGWDAIAGFFAYKFRTGRDGWEQFTEEIGGPGVGEYLVKENYGGELLNIFGERVRNLAPSADQVKERIARIGVETDRLWTAEDFCEAWHEILGQLSYWK